MEFSGGKSRIMFNVAQRSDFLTSFKKRKDIRRQVAKEERQQEERNHRKEALYERKKQNESINQQYA